jgi:hypothetical protein
MFDSAGSKRPADPNPLPQPKPATDPAGRAKSRPP